MIQVSENEVRLDIISRMPIGIRLFFAMLAFLPLLAPYELLWLTRWTDYLNPIFLFVALFSATAMSLSAFLVFAALAGLNSQMTFDAENSTFTHWADAPIVRRRTTQLPLSSIESIHTRTHESSDSEPSYSLGITMSDGSVFESATSQSLRNIEQIKAQTEAFLGRAGHSVQIAQEPKHTG